MQQFKGYEDAKKAAQSSGIGRLPAGAYVCEILGAKEEETVDGNKHIIVQFDIVEGDQKDYFHRQYDANTNEDKKWKGTKKIYEPKDDGSERDGWTKNTFAKWTNSLEESNEGYHWDWDEKKWKGKKIGIVFGDTGTVIDGKEIVYTEARFPISASKVRDGSAPAAKFVAKNGYTGNGSAGSTVTSSDGFMSIPEGLDEELPFN